MKLLLGYIIIYHFVRVSLVIEDKSTENPHDLKSCYPTYLFFDFRIMISTCSAGK